MNIKEYISSGILEAYVLGALSEEEQVQVVADIAAYPELAAEVAAIETTMQQFAEATGGLAYFPKSLDEVEELCKQIAHDLRNRYTLAYTPSNVKPDVTRREIRVVVNPPKAMATKMGVPRHKPGYFAPNPPSQ